MQRDEAIRSATFGAGSLLYASYYSYRPFSVQFFTNGGVTPMIYELRNYTAQPGRLRDLLARFENHTNRIWARYGIRQAGFWTTVVGPTEGLSYLLAWESFAEREEKWNALRADPELLEAFAESEKNGPLVFNVENLLLQPTSFSAVT